MGAGGQPASAVQQLIGRAQIQGKKAEAEYNPSRPDEELYQERMV